MAEAKQFKPLKEFGAIEQAESSKIRFYVDEFKGHPYASIRTFVENDAYSGPTKSGVTLNFDILGKVIDVLEKLPTEPGTTEDKELARFPKRAGLDLAVRITIYRDTTGIDFREWVDDASYKGWSKKGVRVAYAQLGAAIELLKAMHLFLKERRTQPKS